MQCDGNGNGNGNSNTDDWGDYNSSPCTSYRRVKKMTFVCYNFAWQFNPCPAEPGYTLFCKQCKARSVGFWRSQLIWICTVCHQECKFVATIWIKQSDWLKIKSGHGILIYSAGQGLISVKTHCQVLGRHVNPCRDHFLARFCDILAFFCKKSHQNSRSEKKNRTLNFSHFAPLSSYFAHAVHFETIGLFCLTGFWIIVVPKFITHTNAGNHSLICIIEKLYRKNSLSVSGLSKRLFDRYLESAKTCPPTRKKKRKKIIRPEAVQSGWQHVKVSCSSTTQLDRSGHALLPWFGWRSRIKHKTELSLMNNKPMKPLFSRLHFITSQA